MHVGHNVKATRKYYIHSSCTSVFLSRASQVNGGPTRSSILQTVMLLMVSAAKRVFISFLIFGLLNNILYVVILTAAVDIVGFSLPKAIVLLADIMPSLSIKLLAPFVIHKLPYKSRIWILVSLSVSGMLLISLTQRNAMFAKILGISMASLSSGLGEVSFLQLTHFYDETKSIGGFSMGTGGAGILGSFCYLLMTNILGMRDWVALTSFAVVPLGFPIMFFFVLPNVDVDARYEPILQDSLSSISMEMESHSGVSATHWSSQWFKLWVRLRQNFKSRARLVYPLVRPYMVPLCSVYIAEYVINQGVSPTLLFPLEDLPRWLFASYRDIYVVYGFIYQSGVFLSRSSVTFGLRCRKLYILSILQLLNVAGLTYQSLYDAPFNSILPITMIIFYEGLLGGLSYVNTFMTVSQNVTSELREFSMACVGVSDSLGIMIAGIINVWLEKSLCARQVSRGRDWCSVG